MKEIRISHLGEILYHIRKDLGLIRKEFAPMIGCFHQTLYRYEKGVREPTEECMEKALALWGGKTEFVMESRPWLQTRIHPATTTK